MRDKFSFWLAICILFFSATPNALGDPYRQNQLKNGGQRIVTGTIEAISTDKILVKTDDGNNHIVTIAPAERLDYANKGLQEGDRIILSFNHRNRLIGLDKIDEGTPYNKDLWLIGNTRIRLY